jgi:hypothetical protein
MTSSADPADRRARLIAAFCEDLADPAFAITGEALRAAAMVAVSRADRRLESGRRPQMIELPE